MKDLQERIRENLKLIVAEHELEAVLDSELAKARESLSRDVRKEIERQIQSQMEALATKWVKSEQAKQQIEEAFAGSVQAKLKNYLDGDSYRIQNLKNTIDNRLGKEIDVLVNHKLNEKRYSDIIEETSEEVVKKYMPKAMAFALEGLAASALKRNLVQAEVNMGISAGVTCADNQWGCQGKVVPGKYCGECGAYKNT